MSTQPEALQLADWARSYNTTMHNRCAAELRRLHQSEREGWRYAKELEHERKELSALLRQALDCLENHVMQRTYAGGVVICNTAIALRERLGEKK